MSRKWLPLILDTKAKLERHQAHSKNRYNYTLIELTRIVDVSKKN